jgi:molybdenum cofactor biosynthesis enzyme MoaA
MEGDPAHPTGGAGLSTALWQDLLHVALDCGVRKLKFVGGEPLIRRDLPEIIGSLRARDADVDISLVTSGAVPREAIERCFDCGLSRCNMTVHGFRGEDFALRGGSPKQHDLRADFIETVLSYGRPMKINYVYTGARCDDDLAALLDWAAPRPCTIAVLDDLSRPDFDHRTVLGALHRLRGEPVARWDEPDPHSLPALRLRLADGPVVEVKDRSLGAAAPWASCVVCLRRATCREGILALRLTHTGVLRPCMDRADLGVALVPALAAGGRAAAREAWRSWLAEETAS